MKTIIALILSIIVNALFVAAMAQALPQQALCDTDDDCAQICTDNEVDCDGGPAS